MIVTKKHLHHPLARSLATGFPLKNRSRATGLTLALSALACCASCSQPAQQHVQISPEDRAAFQAGQGNVQRTALAMMEGPLPLYATVSGPATVSISVKGKNGTIAQTKIPPGESLVRVDASHGVIVGSETVLNGPLPAAQIYQIYCVGDLKSPSTEGRISK